MRTTPLRLLLAPLGLVVGAAFGWLWLHEPAPWVAVAAIFLLAVWLLVTAKLPRLSAALLWSFGFWFGGLATAFHWVPEVVAFNFDIPLWQALLFFTAMAAADAAGGMAVGWVAHRGLVGGRWSPFQLIPAFVIYEFFFPRVFPWSPAHLLIGLRPLVQVAEFGGTPLVTAVLLAGALLPAMWLAGAGGLPSRRRATAAVAAVWIAAGVFGLWRESALRHAEQDAESLRVAALQVNVMYHGGEVRLRELSQALDPPPELVIWPESSLGVYHESLWMFTDEMEVWDLSREPRCELPGYSRPGSLLLACGKLFGDGTPDEGPYRSTALLIDETQFIIGRYQKRSLLPWGEYVPGQQWIPGLRHLANIDLIRVGGSDPTPLTTDEGLRIGVLICYDDVIPRNARQTVAAGAEILVAQINAADYDDPRTLRQHRLLAQLRAVENRRYLVRSASTGLTCTISPWGEVVAEIPPQEEGVLETVIHPATGLTLYSRWGDWFVYLCLLSPPAAMVWHRRRRPATPRAER